MGGAKFKQHLTFGKELKDENIFIKKTVLFAGSGGLISQSMSVGS